jgi:3-oxoadipate enol-lactonase
MTEWVEVAGTLIAWEAQGPVDAPALVFSHSLGADRWMWAPQVESLAADYRVVLVDTRGHGRSDAPPGPYTVDQLARDVLAVADAAGADRFHLCGLSMGGHIGLWIASNNPERLVSLIACNTAAKLSTPEAWEERIAAVASGGMDSVREAVIDKWFAPGFAGANPDWYKAANRVFSSLSPDGYAACCAALATSDLAGVVAGIEVPTLIIGGSHDVATPPAQAEWLHEMIAGSRLTIFDAAAHLSNLDVADRFTARLRSFLGHR